MNFEEVFSYENLYESARKCCTNVRWKHSTQMFEINMSRWVSSLHKELMTGKYRGKGFTEFDIYERGKKRHIQAVHISERCVQKCLCEYCLKPLIEPRLIYDNSANIKGKGTEFAIRRLKKHLSNHYKKHGRTGGVLIMDYHNYFPSIRHDKVLDMISPLIKDERICALLKTFIDNFGNKGLGLGSEVSQILAVFYRNEIDHYVKERLHIKGYGAYMDDSYLIHQDISYLEHCLAEIRKLSEELGLEFNDKRTKIVRLTDGFTYLQKRFNLTETGKVIVRLSRSNIRRNRVRYKKMVNKGIDAEQSFTCWQGYAEHYDSFNAINNMSLIVRTERKENVKQGRPQRNYENVGRCKKRIAQ